MSTLDEQWVASDYLDNGRYGVLTCPGNLIVIGISVGLDKEQCQKIAEYHNRDAKGDEE